MWIYITKDQVSYEPVRCNDKIIGKGGYGSVYNVLSPDKYNDYCVKIYTDKQNCDPKRLQFMVQNPPATLSNDRFRICWPVAIVCDKNHVPIGYMMLLAFPNSRDLDILEFYNVGQSIQGRYPKDTAWHKKYERNTATGIINRMKLMCNLAIAIQYIHKLQDYVLMDIKPENVNATPDGKISIFDTDSFQITINDRVLFKGLAYTPEYFPRHGYLRVDNGLSLDINCDLFAMAVIIYKILIGSHPYAGSRLKPPYDKAETIEDRIKNGLYVFGDKKAYLDPTNFHNVYYSLPESIKQMFARAFSDRREKPTMAEWIEYFVAQIKKEESKIRNQKILDEKKREEAAKKRQQQEQRKKIISTTLTAVFVGFVIWLIVFGISTGVSSYRYHHTEYKELITNAEAFRSESRYAEAIKALEEARVRKSSKKKIAALSERISQINAERVAKVKELRGELNAVWTTYFTPSNQLNYRNIQYVERAEVLPIIGRTRQKIELLRSITSDQDEYLANTAKINRLKAHFNC